MEDEVGGPLISTNFLNVPSNIRPFTNRSLLSDLSSTYGLGLRIENETASEANDVLKNGILIETSKGLEWLSLTEALASGVGGLNLSVEDFQNVAAQLLHSQNVAAGDVISDGVIAENTSIIKSAGEIVHGAVVNGPSTSNPFEPSDLQCFPSVNSNLESIAETAEHCPEDAIREEVFQPTVISKGITITVTSKNVLKKKIQLLTSSDSSSLTVSESTGTNSDSSVQSAPLIQIKRKGGWPKGRKRKPELTNRPPKAPCTGYVYYLNEKRKRAEFRNVPFPEVTKMLGNEWSSLSLESKKEYLEKAEIDKKRYREELKVYRNSDTYRSYLKRRRIKSCKNNGTEESDVDAADEIDDEDNEELYCRACDQWFTTLHNKKEHLYGKQHFQTLSQNASGSHSIDESSLDGSSIPSLRLSANPELPSVPDAMCLFFTHVAEREREIKTLEERQKMLDSNNKKVLKELQELKQSQNRLLKISARQKAEQYKIEKVIWDLWDVPALFYQQQNILGLP